MPTVPTVTYQLLWKGVSGRAHVFCHGGIDLDNRIRTYISRGCLIVDLTVEILELESGQPLGNSTPQPPE